MPAPFRTTSLYLGSRYFTQSYFDSLDGLGLKGNDIASASTVSIGAVQAEFMRVTGTATISSFGTSTAGTPRTLLFTSSLSVQVSSNIVLPLGESITTQAGDIMKLVSFGGNIWYCQSYLRANGQALANPSPVSKFNNQLQPLVISAQENIVFTYGTVGTLPTGTSLTVNADGGDVTFYFNNDAGAYNVAWPAGTVSSITFTADLSADPNGQSLILDNLKQAGVGTGLSSLTLTAGTDFLSSFIVTPAILSFWAPTSEFSGTVTSPTSSSVSIHIYDSSLGGSPSGATVEVDSSGLSQSDVASAIAAGIAGSLLAATAYGNSSSVIVQGRYGGADTAGDSFTTTFSQDYSTSAFDSYDYDGTKASLVTILSESSLVSNVTVTPIGGGHYTLQVYSNAFGPMAAVALNGSSGAAYVFVSGLAGTPATDDANMAAMESLINSASLTIGGYPLDAYYTSGSIYLNLTGDNSIDAVINAHGSGWATNGAQYGAGNNIITFTNVLPFAFAMNAQTDVNIYMSIGYTNYGPHTFPSGSYDLADICFHLNIPFATLLSRGTIQIGCDSSFASYPSGNIDVLLSSQNY